jgi:hypothetical protein
MAYYGTCLYRNMSPRMAPFQVQEDKEIEEEKDVEDEKDIEEEKDV